MGLLETLFIVLDHTAQIITVKQAFRGLWRFKKRNLTDTSLTI